MEKEGLVRGMQFLKEQKFSIATFVTDRHIQIAKWMREKSFNTDVNIIYGILQKVSAL